jgi:hypothetical protein
MTFGDAIKSGRPMRRKFWTLEGEWLALGYDGPNDAVGTPRWREVRSGKAVGLRYSDYTATDWEILP